MFFLNFILKDYLCKKLFLKNRIFEVRRKLLLCYGKLIYRNLVTIYSCNIS